MHQIYVVMLRSILYTSLVLAQFVLANAQTGAFLPCHPYGGDQSVRWMIEQELRYPQDALDSGITGKVAVIFVVEPTGVVRDMRIWQGLHPSCDAEALRVARLIRWYPASVGGSSAAAEHYVQVDFDPKQYRKWLKERAARCKETFTTTWTNDTVYTSRQVAQQPEPVIPNGIRGLPAHLSANMKYPPEAYRRDFQGTVRLEFVVEPSGSISNMRALDELGGGCTEEAERLVRAVCWKPAQRNGAAVRCTFEVSIRFVIAPNTR